MTKQLDTIGTTELIALAEQGLHEVPAKIDTGADSSSIWASNITLQTGTLNFSLFGVGSGFYSGEIMSTNEFKITTVKNSFGTLEFRYKVPLLIQIGKRTIRGWFTLADRSTMQFPVLLGRRLLNNKFIVDVSKRKLHTTSVNDAGILILASADEGLTEFAAQIQASSKSNSKVHTATYNELLFNVDSEKTSVKVLKNNSEVDLAEYRAVYFKSHKSYTELAKAAACYLNYKNVLFLDKELLEHTSYDKLTEYTRLSLYGIAVPQLFAGTRQVLKAFIENSTDIKFPLVYKEINADRGRNNYFISSQKELAEAVEKSDPHDIYVLQQYILNEGYLRIFNFGRTAQVIVKRTPAVHKDPLKQHLNNPVGSKNAELLTAKSADPKAVELAMRASVVMDRQVSGVDLIQDKDTKKWYVLEVNNAPQLKTGSFVNEKIKAMSKFIDNELNR